MFLALVIIVAVFLVTVFKKKGREWQYLRNIPQPPAYPIIGHLLSYTCSPETMFIETRQRSLAYYPIYKINVLGLCSVNLVSPGDIELVLTDMKQNTKGHAYELLHGWLGTGLLTSAGAKWQSRRKLLTPAFHFSILREFISIFIAETEKLVADLERDCHKPYTDVVVPVTHFTLLSIGETAMHIDLDNYKDAQKGYKHAIYEMGRLLMYRAPRPWLHSNAVYGFTRNGKAQKEVIKTLHDFSSKTIADRKKNFSYSTRKRLAMLDLLLKYRSEGADIDDEGIREEVDTLMFEGHDTTSMAICFSLMLLANEKEAQDEIYKEIERVIGDDDANYGNLNQLQYMERCIKEILRLYPSVPFISRVCGNDIQTTTGYTIPRDTVIDIHIYDLHHNPNVWPNPEQFDPDRFLPENTSKRHPFAFLPFSAGPRNCIGQKFAMLEIKTVLVGILKKFVLVPIDTPEDITFIADLVLRPKDKIKVKFVPRS